MAKIILKTDKPDKAAKILTEALQDEVFEDTNVEFEINPIKTLRGCNKESNLTEKLITSRRKDLEIEERKWKR